MEVIVQEIVENIALFWRPSRDTSILIKYALQLCKFGARAGMMTPEEHPCSGAKIILMLTCGKT